MIGEPSDALDCIVTAIKNAGYDTERVKLAIDAASGEWYKDGKYFLPKSSAEYTSEELCGYWSDISKRYPVVSIEDGLAEDDTE